MECKSESRQPWPALASLADRVLSLLDQLRQERQGLKGGRGVRIQTLQAIDDGMRLLAIE